MCMSYNPNLAAVDSMQISDIENIFLFLTLLFLSLYGLASLIDSKPHWFRSSKLLKARKMQSDYEKRLQSRRDLLHHYFWSESNNEKNKMQKLQSQIVKLDKDLLQLREEYKLVRKGIPVPLKVF